MIARMLVSTVKVIARAAWERVWRPDEFREFVEDVRRLRAEIERAERRHAARDQGELRHLGDTASVEEWGHAG